MFLNRFDRWPEEALIDIAVAYFRRGDFISKEINQSDEVSADNLARLCVKVHSFARELTDKMWLEMKRRFFITPANYLHFVQVTSFFI